MAIFQYRDKQLNYELHAALAPEDMLLIHGNLASNRWWLPTVQALRSHYKGQRFSGSVAMADWLGCGRSSAPASLTDLDMKSLAHDYVELAKGIGLKDICLVGHSTGALIGLCAMLEAPDLFKSAVLLDPVSAKGLHFGPEMYATFSKMSQDLDFCSQIMASTIYGCDPNDEFIKQLFKDAYGVNEKIWHGIPDALKNIDISTRLKEITQPVLVLHGEQDQMLDINESRAIAMGLANGSFVEIEKQGHSCNVENPKRFAEFLTNFIAP